MFWVLCSTTVVLTGDERELVLGPMIAGALVLALAHLLARLMKRGSGAVARGRSVRRVQPNARRSLTVRARWSHGPLRHKNHDAGVT